MAFTDLFKSLNRMALNLVNSDRYFCEKSPARLQRLFPPSLVRTYNSVNQVGTYLSKPCFTFFEKSKCCIVSVSVGTYLFKGYSYQSL